MIAVVEETSLPQMDKLPNATLTVFTHAVQNITGVELPMIIASVEDVSITVSQVISTGTIYVVEGIIWHLTDVWPNAIPMDDTPVALITSGAE